MKEITAYETDDGQIFKNKISAEFHEDSLRYYKKFKVTVTLTRYIEQSTRLYSIDEVIDEIKEGMDNEYHDCTIKSCDVNVEVIDDG